MDVAFRIIPQK